MAMSTILSKLSTAKAIPGVVKIGKSDPMTLARQAVIKNIEEQQSSIEAMIKNVSFLPKRIKRITGPDGKKEKVEVTRRFAHWFQKDSKGQFWTFIKSSGKMIELKKGESFVGPFATLEALNDAYDVIKNAVSKGEIDQQIVESKKRNPRKTASK